MTGAVPDRIEKQVLLRAPLARVWRAITDSQQFGSWFGVKFNAPFKAGERIVGQIAPTTADPEVAALYSFRWHPAAIDPKVDYSGEPATLVEFALKEAPDGVMLTVTESGFDRIPLSRRAEAFKMNEGGWAAQMTLIEKYLAKAS